MAEKIDWSLIKDYESFNNQVELVDRIGKGANGIVIFYANKNFYIILLFQY